MNPIRIGALLLGLASAGLLSACSKATDEDPIVLVPSQGNSPANAGQGGTSSEPAEAGTNEPSAGTTGAAGTAGTRGTAGTAGTSSADMRPECLQVDEPMTLDVTTPAGTSLVEDVTAEITGFGGGFRQLDIEGVVSQVTSGSFVVERCLASQADAGLALPVDGGCSNETWTFNVVAPGLTLPVAVGDTVQVNYTLYVFFGVGANIIVRDASDDAELSDAERILLVATSGYGFTLGEMQFAAESVDLGCFDVEPSAPCGAAPRTYALRIFPVWEPQNQVLVHMGETQTLTANAPAGLAWDARNLRSYSEGSCDEHNTTKYYIAQRR